MTGDERQREQARRGLEAWAGFPADREPRPLVLLGPAARPRWNFHKYLVAPDGTLADWFSTVAGPTSRRVLGGIERVLPN